MNKHTVGALRTAGMIASVALVTSLFITIVNACEPGEGGKWPQPDPNKWGACVQTECGSNKGTQTQTITCSDKNGTGECTLEKSECPTSDSAYTSNDDDKECKREIDDHWKYADKVVTEAADTKVVSQDCTVSEVTACETTPTETPTPTVTEAPAQPQGNNGGPGDGLSDGRSDGRSSCPECTAPPKGQVLGATTEFAGTGTADEMVMNAVGAIGGLSTGAGIVLSAKKKLNI